MRKGLFIALILALLLLAVACKRIELQPSAQPEQKIVKLPEVPVKEEPKPIEVPVEQKPIEIPVQEEPKAELPKEIKNEFIVRKGDSFNFGDYKVNVKDIQSSTFVVLDVNGETITFTETRTFDIIGKLKLTYANSNFSRDSTITLKAEDFKLKDGEQMVKYRDTVTSYGETVKIDSITYDEGFKEDAIWVSLVNNPADSNTHKILEGKSLSLGNVTISAIKVSTNERQYAHISIKPKS